MKAKHKKLPVGKLIIVGGLVALAASVAYFGFATRTSVVPTMGGKNFSLKISNTSQGIAFVSVGTAGKKSIPTGHNSPTLDVIKGDTVTIHIISEIHGQKYNFIIPDLNVQSKQIGYFESDTITFVADKQGEFVYTSTDHPEMKGLLVVQ
jgi:hypothetical protein